MKTGYDIAIHIMKEAERIEREKDGRALTPDEVRTLRAGTFLKQIMVSPEGKLR